MNMKVLTCSLKKSLDMSLVIGSLNFAPSEDSDQTGHDQCLCCGLLCTQWIAKDLMPLQVDSEVSDQTGRMSRLI